MAAVVGSTGVDVAIATVSLVLGYAFGSLPLSALVGRAAGIEPGPGRESGLGPSRVWTLAGPGWGFLALVADLARGILPVTLAAATFSWGAGWLAGLGAVVGASWPALGRIRGGLGTGVLAGALIALEPAAALAAAVLALAVVLGGRVLGRDARSVAVVVAIGAYPLLFVLLELDLARLAAVIALYLVAVARYAMEGRR